MIIEKEMPTVQQSSLALYQTAKILERLQILFMLDGGTLLGFYRDGFFAADDHDDIDLTVNARDWNKAGELFKQMTAEGFELYHEWPRKDGKTGQLAFKRDNVKVDIMFKEFTDKAVLWTIYGGPNGLTHKAVPIELLYTVKSHEIKLPLGNNIVDVLHVGIPEHVEDYLTFRYGDWKTPVHRKEYSCYSSDKSIVTKETYNDLL